MVRDREVEGQLSDGVSRRPSAAAERAPALAVVRLQDATRALVARLDQLRVDAGSEIAALLLSVDAVADLIGTEDSGNSSRGRRRTRDKVSEAVKDVFLE